MSVEHLIRRARMARAQRGYEESLAKDEEREWRRNRMYDLLDYALGNDTEGAREVAEGLARVAESKGKTKVKPRPTTKAQRKAAEKQAREARPKMETVVDPDGIIRSVEVKGKPLRSGLEEHQRKAATDFERDWEAAVSSLRCRGFEPAVDGGPIHSRAHLPRVEAQARLRQLEERLGPEDWILLKAMVLGGATPTEIHRRGGPEHRTAAYEIRRVLDRVSSFYAPGLRRRSAMLDACEAIVEEMEKQMAQRL